jgi:DNA-binding transcriptional ArsR family regulator
VPIPLLPEAFTAVLKLDRAAALAAAFLIGNHHADILLFAARMVGGDELAEPRPRAVRRRPRKVNGHGAGRRNGDPHLDRRREARDEADARLLEAMRRNAEATIGELATAVGKSRTSIVSGLHRLRAAGLVQSVEGKWKLTEEPAPREPAQPWIQPLKGSRETKTHAHA